jgi:hypothetical protein
VGGRLSICRAGHSFDVRDEDLGHAGLKTGSIYVSLARETINKELQEHAL